MYIYVRDARSTKQVSPRLHPGTDERGRRANRGGGGGGEGGGRAGRRPRRKEKIKRVGEAGKTKTSCLAGVPPPPCLAAEAARLRRWPTAATCGCEEDGPRCMSLPLSHAFSTCVLCPWATTGAEDRPMPEDETCLARRDDDCRRAPETRQRTQGPICFLLVDESSRYRARIARPLQQIRTGGHAHINGQTHPCPVAAGAMRADPQSGGLSSALVHHTIVSVTSNGRRCIGCCARLALSWARAPFPGIPPPPSLLSLPRTMSQRRRVRERGLLLGLVLLPSRGGQIEMRTRGLRMGGRGEAERGHEDTMYGPASGSMMRRLCWSGPLRLSRSISFTLYRHSLATLVWDRSRRERQQCGRPIRPGNKEQRGGRAAMRCTAPT
ncbi:hypothetical protein CDD83_548 [Cordyceps sp. RAO-2017]|nr:hypothetical protein CDD83_548 [Cordyceps sp. RAO-2017]